MALYIIKSNEMPKTLVDAIIRTDSFMHTHETRKALKDKLVRLNGNKVAGQGPDFKINRTKPK